MPAKPVNKPFMNEAAIVVVAPLYHYLCEQLRQTQRKIHCMAVGNHPAIISKEAFDAAKAERPLRTNKENGENGMYQKSTRYSIRRSANHEK